MIYGRGGAVQDSGELVPQEEEDDDLHSKDDDTGRQRSKKSRQAHALPFPRLVLLRVAAIHG